MVSFGVTTTDSSSIFEILNRGPFKIPLFGGLGGTGGKTFIWNYTHLLD